jgi:chromosome partitioning protein
MKIWTVANQKGGVGKTTTAINVGGELALRGRRVLLLDLDPHGSMTSYFGLDPDAVERSVYTLFNRYADGERVPLAAMLAPTGIEGLALLPASTALVTLDRQMGSQDGGGLILARALQDWSSRFDHCILDCPPMLGILMINALAAGDRLLVPVQTEYLALQGLKRLLHTLELLFQGSPGRFQPLLVPTLFDRRTRESMESLEWLLQHYPGLLWPGYIPVDTLFKEASRIGRPLALLRPKSRGAEAYRGLVDYLLEAEART